MKLGLDFDGCITYFPQFLSKLSYLPETQTYIITGKRKKSKLEIEYMLDKLGIKYDSIHCYQGDKPSTLESEIEHKVSKCKELCIDVFVDDKLEVVKAIGERTNAFVLWRGN